MKRRLRSYPVEYQEKYSYMLIEHMAEGYSYRTFGAVLGLSATVLDKWCSNVEEFKEAKEIGKLCQLKKWEELLLLNASGAVSGGSGALKFAMTNYFPEEFKEKSTVDHNGNVVFQIESGIDHDKAKGMEYIEGEFRYIGDEDKGQQPLKQIAPSKEESL